MDPNDNELRKKLTFVIWIIVPSQQLAILHQLFCHFDLIIALRSFILARLRSSETAVESYRKGKDMEDVDGQMYFQM